VKRNARAPREGTPAGRWIDGRFVRPQRNLLPVLIEQAVTEEPVVVEPGPGKPAWRPAGFWRGSQFHRVLRVFGRRFERETMWLRVLSERGGVFELRRTLEMDPWSFRARWRWDLVALIRLVSVRRLPSDRRQWIWPTGARSR
jgi:hypothetical protein